MGTTKKNNNGFTSGDERFMNLCDAHRFICNAEKYFILRDETNAMLHLDPCVRYSEITKRATTTRHMMEEILRINIPPKAGK